MKASRYWRMARTDPAWFVQRLREEAEARAADARRRARREADEALRGVVTRSGLPRVIAGEQAARADYFAVLDGRTLNLHARLPISDPAPDRAEIIFVRRGREVQAHASLSANGELSATVLLGSDLGGVALGMGRWRIAVAVFNGDSEKRLRLLGPAHLTGSSGGPTLPSPPCPRTGIRFAPQLSPTGLCALHITPPHPAAEVAGFRMSFAHVEIDLRLVGVDAAALNVDFQARGAAAAGRLVHSVEAAKEDDVFRVRAPLAEMAHDARATERVWNLVAEVPGHGRLRVGRRLHDVRDPRRVLRMPLRPVSAGGDALLRVRPYYTGNGDLAIACATLVNPLEVSP